MRLIRHLHRADPGHGSTAVAVGNFDALHRGHQALIRAAVESGPDLVPALMCFEPLPQTFLSPEQPVPRLLTLRDRVELCRQSGVELLYVLRFDAAFAAQTPKVFARNILARGAQARKVIVGEDFRFGHKAAGGAEDLRAFGEQYAFQVQVIDAVVESGEKISASAIRRALASGDLARAERLLGRKYRISGRVRRGRRLGRDLGFPTVNLRVPEPPALAGIFAVRVHGAGLESHPGVASLGRRPTVAGREWLLEVHLFDSDRELYGLHLAVDFIGYLRPEAHFESLERMKRQMQADAERARAMLGVRVD